MKSLELSHTGFELYRKGQFTEAITAFTTMLDQDKRSSTTLISTTMPRASNKRARPKLEWCL